MKMGVRYEDRFLQKFFNLLLLVITHAFIFSYISPSDKYIQINLSTIKYWIRLFHISENLKENEHMTGPIRFVVFCFN